MQLAYVGAVSRHWENEEARILRGKSIGREPARRTSTKHQLSHHCRPCERRSRNGRGQRIPKSLREFISSHHGTQVVRWFYVKARDAATEDEEVEEASFRYPGPRPRSKEAAVLMLADACESASRAAVELPSGKIESIVRDLSKERLLDGQFDECNLTLRELHEIEDAIIGRLRSIRHQRLAYPDDQDDSASPDSSS